ncbi:MAG: TetR/AcrR family transcriptional regulator [Acidimicrobiales bacterium]
MARTRLSPGNRRAQLVDLGLEVLSTRPLDRVSVDEIAAAAGISRGLLFHYFDSKRDYLVAVVRAAADQLLELTTPDPSLPPVEQLRDGLERYVAFVDEHREIYVGLLRGGGGDADLQAIFDETRAVIAHRVLAGVGAADDPSPVVQLVARGWVGFVEEAAIEWLGSDRSLSKGELVTLLEQSLVQLLLVAAQGAANFGSLSTL